MGLQAKLEEKLNKIYEPSSRIDDTFKGNAITFITNEHGEAITLFIGKRRPDGAITGERYVRRIQRQEGSNTIKKSHWELKGKVSRA
jgi:hypothetical protein